jgi:FK506-binding protein 2
MKQTIAINLTFLSFISVCLLDLALALATPSTQFHHKDCNRRVALSHLITPAAALLVLSSSAPALASIAEPDPQGITTVILHSSKEKAGVELYDVKLGTPPKSYPAVRSVDPAGAASSAGVKPGMIMLGNFPDGSKSVVARMKQNLYPLVFQFYNLAAETEGDVLPQDALRRAEQASQEAAKREDPQLSPKGTGLGIRTTRPPSSVCGIKSRRYDMMEIKYEARVASPGGPLYDSSAQRGTGQPYQFVLGNGDLIKGVDLGLYDMCPGEIRELDIPSLLGYGRNGSVLFDIPGDVRLWWKVELVRLNFVNENENQNSRDTLYTGGSGEDAPISR